MHDREPNLPEPGPLQQRLQFNFTEAKVEVGIDFAGLFEAMADEVEHANTATWLENPPGFGDGAVRVQGVMKRLAEERQVDGGVGDRHCFQIPAAIFEVREALPGGEFPAVVHHLLGAIDRDHLPGALRQQ